MRSQAISKLFPLAVLAVYLYVSAGATADSIIRSGRRIQLDGFLIEWGVKNRHVWHASGPNGWYWDAVNTVEGIAGYFHCPATPCSSWTICADARLSVSKPLQIRIPDPVKAGNNFVCVNRAIKDSLYVITAEWILPWDSAGVDRTGKFLVRITGTSSCGDTLQPLCLTGSAIPRTNKGKGFAKRIILLTALAIFFVVMHSVRKKTRRRE